MKVLKTQESMVLIDNLKRSEIYKKYIKLLIDKGDAYYAFDKKEDLDQLRKNMKKKGRLSYIIGKIEKFKKFNIIK